MRDNNNSAEFLEGFSKTPPPQGLRARILKATAERKQSARLLPSLLFKAGMISAVVAAFCVIVDAGLEDGQKKRLAALTGSRYAIPLEGDDQSFILGELVAGDANAAWASLRLKLQRRAKEREIQLARKKLLRRNIDEY